MSSSLGSGSPPTLDGFRQFVTNVMRPPTSAITVATDETLVWAYTFAKDWVYDGLCCVPSIPGGWTLYARAVYNLAADTLINWEQGDPDAPIYKNNLPYWAWLRSSYGVNEFVPGVIQSSADVSTSESLVVPEAFKELTIANLGNLKTPYGVAYLGIAQSWGGIWGIS